MVDWEPSTVEIPLVLENINAAMTQRKLSPREEEIVELSLEGLTNEAVAHRLGIGVGTVNTYWLRIKQKVGGLGKTDTVGRVMQDRADKALIDATNGQNDMATLVLEKERGDLDLRAALALLQLAMDQFKATVWAADKDLRIFKMVKGEFPPSHFGWSWEAGKTVCEIFKTNDPNDPVIAAHLAALNGQETSVKVSGSLENLFIRVIPLTEENGEPMGCITIVTLVN